MKKIVNGALVDMTPDEVSQITVEQSEWLSEAEEITPQKAREQAIDALIKDRARQPNPPAEVVMAASLLG